MNTIRVSNSLDPDQARHLVGPVLGPNCLQRSAAEGGKHVKCRMSIKEFSGLLFKII